ncbi:TerD family protein [Streptomyces litchfieldiae]|uniref:TerD family protein n=1 Tax=Streptomyces litchfieldiae TaxID=3075543 RepID=A0ABU2MTM5_9ACTN|nr:TerD family protein [Streptomyces sp. DSM 44938]MDT0344988.1 TerD family protein [Streptomyces sp. DSM 44938]
MSGPSKGLGKVEVQVRWDPSPSGRPATDLDIIAGTYRADDPFGDPVYLVHFDSRSPDGTITLSRDSRTGQGFGYDEVMTLEFDRLAEVYGRVVVGVAIQQSGGRKTFADVAGAKVRVAEGYTELATDEFAGVAGSTAATVAQFIRNDSGAWSFAPAVRGYDAGPEEFARIMGAGPA